MSLNLIAGAWCIFVSGANLTLAAKKENDIRGWNIAVGVLCLVVGIWSLSQ